MSGFVVAGCSNDGEAAGGSTPTPSAPSSTFPVEPTGSPTEPAWVAEYTPEEIADYESALARWQEYSEKTAQIYRSGRDTEAAREVFREYDMQATSRIRSLAETYDAGGLRTVRGPSPIGTMPVSVKPQLVVISQCNDYSEIEVTRDGQSIDGVKPDHLQTPIVIEMDKAEDHDWMVARVELKDTTSCAA